MVITTEARSGIKLDGYTPVYPINLHDNNAIAVYMARYAAIDISAASASKVIFVAASREAARVEKLAALYAGVALADIELVRLEEMDTSAWRLDFNRYLAMHGAFAFQYRIVRAIYEKYCMGSAPQEEEKKLPSMQEREEKRLAHVCGACGKHTYAYVSSTGTRYYCSYCMTWEEEEKVPSMREEEKIQDSMLAQAQRSARRLDRYAPLCDACGNPMHDSTLAHGLYYCSYCDKYNNEEEARQLLGSYASHSGKQDRQA